MPSSTQLGRYRLLERIGVGGTAEVFRASVLRGDGSEETVVLKRVLPQHAKDDRFARLFREEALLLASLEHENIVRLRDFGEMQGTLFLALEYVDGASLAELLRRPERPPAPLAVAVTLEVCAALDYIHDRRSEDGTALGIVHRDISPHNILVAASGVVKLLDFGIARSVIREDRTVDGALKGKLAYMSPEQATPGATLDARSDLFSLGAVLYEMLFGRSPFDAASEVEILDRVRACRFELDAGMLAPRDRPLVPVLDRALQLDPNSRHASAADLAGDLRGYLDGLPGAPARGQIAEWVTSEAASPAGAGALVGELLGGEGALRSETAVLARPGDAAAQVAVAAPAAPRARSLTVLQILLVAAVTATLTLAVVAVLISSGPDPSRPRVERPGTGAAEAAPVTAPLERDVGLARDAGTGASAPAKRGVPPRVAKKLQPGRLTVNSIPWARVYLDGRLIGTTPLQGRVVPAGRHRVVLKDGQGRLLRSFVAPISPGHNSVFSFDRSAP